MTHLRIVSKYPKAAAIIEAQRVAEAMRSGADALDELADAASEYEVGTLRRELRGIVLAVVHAAVDAEGES